MLNMDYQSTNLIEIWKDLATLTINSCNEIDNGLQVSNILEDISYDFWYFFYYKLFYIYIA